MAHHLIGTRRRRAMRLLALGCVTLTLAGCAAQMAYRDGEKLVADGQVEAGLVKYREAVAAEPGNARYKNAFLQARDRNTTRLVEQAERELANGQAAPALQNYQRALALDPAHERARAGLRLVEADARHAVLLADAAAAFDKKDYELARQKTAAILSERPNHEAARLLAAQVTEKTAAPAAEAGLSAAYKLPLNIEFRDASLKQVFEVVSRRSGLNFLFDKDVKTDQRTSIFLKNSTVEAAIYYLLVSNQLEQQVMDGNTILVYPNNAVKLKEYQEMTVKTFFLANADAKVVANTLKTILKSRDVVVDEKLNLVILRDSPEAVRLASRLVALQDVAEPEVMLDVEILEIKRSRLMDLGISWPSSLGFAPLQTAAGGALTIDALRDLNSGNIGVTGVSLVANANKTDGDSNTLANPRIRVRNREKAKVVIGDKVPNITSIITAGASGGIASESINYIDVGLTLNVEPTIYLNNEVAIRISLEVSNLVDSVTTKSGSVAYRIGTRSAATMLQLKDGENQVLAGLINNEDRTSGSKVPGFGSLPILGRLFGSTRDSTDKTEIVLSITPHLVRNIQRPAQGASEFSAGTETSFRRRPDTNVRAPVVMPATVTVTPAAPSPANTGVIVTPLPAAPPAPPVQ
ncbi:general secretion pathway protein GspD [Massilia eurypsychrophila]|uniref:General secretion pathway protein GspD n=1 Tax=Massilia eurypsychrophila TaxID=1485217 RepID=A0A2G8TFB8_9BURK|nr:secretin N-terminal domain-containing protein [Massilia eurypsychrophila]PIL44745.1 general secretion pathway protein GspD [Massilia eurypsychrophila]